MSVFFILYFLFLVAIPAVEIKSKDVYTVNLSFLTTHRDRTVTILFSFRHRTVQLPSPYCSNFFSTVHLPSTYRPPTVHSTVPLPFHYRPFYRPFYRSFHRPFHRPFHRTIGLILGCIKARSSRNLFILYHYSKRDGGMVGLTVGWTVG